jgi:hypothetical protein
MDILVDEKTNDIVFINGESPVTTTIRIGVAQRLKVTLQTFLGEWFLDTDLGVPYFESIFGKVSSKSSVDLILQEKILADEGVIEITSFTSSLSAATRVYTMSFAVLTNEGPTDVIDIVLGA